MEETKAKGLRKVGIGLAGITALSVGEIEFNIAVLITIISVVGVLIQGFIDYNDKLR